MKLGQGSYSQTNGFPNLVVGNYSSIAEDCYFHEAGDNHYCESNKNCVYTTNFRHSDKDKAIKIGNDVWVGRGVKILPSVTIGDGVIIGAYSVVAKDIPDFAVVVGNPAEITRFRFNDEQIKKLRKIKWWKWPDTKVSENKVLMEDINKFLEKYA